MLTIAIFTYRRLSSLNKCIMSLQSNNISEVLMLAEQQNLFHDQSLIFYEHSKNQEPIKKIGNLINVKSKNYGDSSITIFKLFKNEEK